MPCTEAYKEHIMYTFHGFCRIVIRNAAITAWRDQHRRHKREISLEYLTEEKFYPLGTTDEYFEASYEEHTITVCGQNFCAKKWRCFHMGNPNLLPYETIVRATSGEPEAVDKVLWHYSKRIRIAVIDIYVVNFLVTSINEITDEMLDSIA